MGKSSKTSSTSNTVATPWSESQPLLKQLLGDTANIYGSGGFDVAPWGGISVAPQSTMTQGGLQGLYDIASAGNPIMPGATSAFNELVSGQGTTDALGQLKQNVLADVVPATAHLFSRSGMLDSSMAADTVGRAAASAVAPIEYGAWENAQNRRLSALGMAPQLAAGQYIDPQMMLQGGGQQDQYMQSILDAAMGNYYEQANRPYDEIQKAASLAMGFGGMGGTQSSSGTQPSGNSTMGTIGGVMQALSFPLMLALSDRRLKTAIRRIGATAEGYPKYAFRYLWDAPDIERIGVMADEVPEGIVYEIAGYKAVDYSGVTL